MSERWEAEARYEDRATRRAPGGRPPHPDGRDRLRRERAASRIAPPATTSSVTAPAPSTGRQRDTGPDPEGPAPADTVAPRTAPVVVTSSRTTACPSTARTAALPPSSSPPWTTTPSPPSTPRATP